MTVDDHADPGSHAAGHDEHHDPGALGPVDWRMWGAGALGTVMALVVVAATVVATGFAFLGVRPA